MKIVDLSRELYHRTPSYPGHPAIIHGVWKTHEESFADGGGVHGLSSMFITMPDHAGTHIDAPRHFDKTGQPISEYPLENCIVPGICIDLRHIAPRAEIAPSGLEAAVKKAGVAVPAMRKKIIAWSRRRSRSRQAGVQVPRWESALVPNRALRLAE